MGLKIFLLILMFSATLCCVDYIANKGKMVEVNGVELKQSLTNVSCICITIACIAYNAAFLWLLVRVI